LVPELYVEGPASSDSAALIELLRAIRSLGARAKIRTGGVTLETIPSARVTAEFLRACVAVAVPFKATAGLHHLVRGEYPLTYEPASARATMFGFLNVFMASALAQTDAPLDELVAVLEEREPGAFEVRHEQLCWRDRCLTSTTLRGMRANALHSIGSCSFQEPIAELTAAGFVAAE
jgi:hypothetical protein